MNRLGGGSHSGIYDRISEADARDEDRNILKPALGQSDRTPAPRVQCQISEGHLLVPIYFPNLPGVVLYLERLTEPLQPATLVG